MEVLLWAPWQSIIMERERERLLRICLSFSKHYTASKTPPFSAPSEGQEIVGNLTLAYNKAGTSYVWTWIQPSGYSNPMVAETLGTLGTSQEPEGTPMSYPSEISIAFWVSNWRKRIYC